ncbi:hypothetical protein QN277_019645 [Acacia crassicarpa]|uniref:Uncharacterized protein n=1 Tax=Acacia crassicarpa TaxID=499986 RepID=A0AAE1MK87_9FABA|nr:hypothetical protein QN277_019645 [Acacia crassicarpa]
MEFMENARPTNRAMTFDEVSMERSKSFVNALQELKNLRPQLYSAAEYCEKSYFHSEQKQMVLDNLKDYAVRALVNAVDHLGTVAYKLGDLLEQQTLDVSTMDSKVFALNQQLLTCRIYTDKEGLRQQELFALIPRHHKHYILPSSVNKKVHFSPVIQTDARQTLFQARSRSHLSGTPASRTLSWHLASETKSTLKGTSYSSAYPEDSTISTTTMGAFQLSDNEESTRMKSSAAQVHFPNGGLPSSTDIQTMGITRKDSLEGSKPMTAFKSFDNQNRREIPYVPARGKSVLSAFFAKQKNPKTSYVS